MSVPKTFTGGEIVLAAFVCLLALAVPTARAQTENKEPGVPILFIHHSCGGQLLAAPGEAIPAAGLPSSQCIFTTHPNGGDLRRLLTEAGFVVHEASYGSVIGQDTDIHDWHQKFRDQMSRIIATRQQDELLPPGQTNRIVAFKSCFPNNDFSGPGSEPGDPDSSELTVVNAKAAYRSLLPFFAGHPEVLFVAMTAPPLAEPRPQGMAQKIKHLFSGSDSGQGAALARQFNNWLADTESGWLAGYGDRNIRVFDYYDILTNGGPGNWSAYPTGNGQNSHPSSAGNTKAAAAFVSFLAAAVNDTTTR